MVTLSGIEMGLALAKVPHRGAVYAAMEVLRGAMWCRMPKGKPAVA